MTKSMKRFKVFQLVISVVMMLSDVKPESLTPPLITMNNGLKIPAIGFGTYPLDNSNKTMQILRDAISVGYRMFDTAFQYDNEVIVGQAIQESIKSGKLKREDFFVVTKIWNTYHSRELVHKQTKMSLDNLKLDYVDLLLMHYPTGYACPGDSEPKLWFPKYPNGTTIPSSWKKDDYIETYYGMEDMVSRGFAKSIGVSNFNTKQIDKLLEKSSIKPVINQFECNPFYNQIRLVRHCRKLGILPEAYSPLHPDVSTEPIITKIGQKYNKSATAVTIRWLLERGLILAAKTTHKDRMIDNLNVFDFNLTKTEVIEILKLKAKSKKIDDKRAHTHPDYPFFEPLEPIEDSNSGPDMYSGRKKGPAFYNSKPSSPLNLHLHFNDEYEYK